MRKLLRDLGGWPVLEGRNWKPWDNSWEKQLAHIMNRTGVNAIILELAVSHDPLNSSKFIIEVDQGLIKWNFRIIVYQELEATGASSMRKLLRDLGGWPVLEGRNWKPWDNSWEKQLAHIMNRTGVNAIILELAVSHDPLNSSKFIIE
ncbi:hypothetical protein WUBG_16837, partial [Wuchereria bancrofti]